MVKKNIDLNIIIWYNNIVVINEKENDYNEKNDKHQKVFRKK